MDADAERPVRVVDRLTEKEVKNARPDKGKFVKRLLDGGGLYLQATRSVATATNCYVLVQGKFRSLVAVARHRLSSGF
jgi:hypothetical protein